MKKIMAQTTILKGFTFSIKKKKKDLHLLSFKLDTLTLRYIYYYVLMHLYKATF